MTSSIAVLDQLPATPQRRPVWQPRRIRHVGSFAKFSLAAAALVVVAIVGINLASRSGQPIVGIKNGVTVAVGRLGDPSVGLYLASTPTAAPTARPSGPLA